MLQRGLNTLADLGDSHVIYADCPLCSRSVKLNTAQIGRRYGRELTIAALKYRLTCRNCGARPREIRIVYSMPSRSC
jgi:C4-type Zn-finger protein